jgi:hypothetical protein
LHHEVIAAKLAAVYQRHIRRLIINLPPRHLKFAPPLKADCAISPFFA